MSRFADIEQELSLLFRRAPVGVDGDGPPGAPGLDAAGYALISQIDLGTPPGSTGVRASDVATALGLDKSTVSRGIAQLERIGLIERVPDPDDGRARLLRLTADGAERFGAIRAQRRAEFEAILERWETADLEQLAKLLHRLNTDIG